MASVDQDKGGDVETDVCEAPIDYYRGKIVIQHADELIPIRGLIAFESFLEKIVAPELLETWGIAKNTKTPRELFKEVITEESFLMLCDDCELLRFTRVAVADIIYSDSGNGEFLRLREKKQVYKDDRPIRVRKLRFSLGEKIRGYGESSVQALVRGIGEELGWTQDAYDGPFCVIDDGLELISAETLFEGDQDTYPGIHTEYQVDSYIVILNPSWYDPEGYIIEEDDKVIYWEWTNDTDEIPFP